MPALESPTTIAEVLVELDQIVESSGATGSRLGYFAALYRRVTRTVRDDIQAGLFDDGPRMERFDVIFARRYLDALAQFRTGQRTGAAWQVAFDAAQSWRPIVLQHLLAAMNAHILLDLGIAAARTSPGQSIHSLRNDFNRINAVLSALVDQVQSELAQIWPALALLDRIAGRSEETVINFSMQAARDFAWNVATQLAPLDESLQQASINALDAQVARLGGKIVNPGWLVSSVTLAVRVTERGSIGSKISKLAEHA